MNVRRVAVSAPARPRNTSKGLWIGRMSRDSTAVPCRSFSAVLLLVNEKFVCFHIICEWKEAHVQVQSRVMIEYQPQLCHNEVTRHLTRNRIALFPGYLK